MFPTQSTRNTGGPIGFTRRLHARYGRKGSRLLEIGSGLGHLVGQLGDDFSTCALDVNLWALQQSQRENPNTGFASASAQEIPYRSGSLGVVICKHVVEHLPHPQQAIQEMGRVLEPGGVLVLSTPNLDSILKPLKGERWIGYQDPTHISLRSPADWFSDVEKLAGLHIIKKFSDGCWDAPYIPLVPTSIQKVVFGSLGGFQAISTVIFLPRTWGESIIIIAKKPG